MYLIVTVVFSLLAPLLVEADYECLCSYKVEMPVNSQVTIMSLVAIPGES